MLKWIASGCLVIILIVVGVSYYGYRQMSKLADEGPAATVVMAATPERIFASLANLDSFATWRSSVRQATPGRTGMLKVGDTLRETVGRDSARATETWVVDTLVANQLLVMRTLYTPNAPFTAIRRDSIVAAGDSTRVTSVVELLISDSVRARAQGAGGGMMNAATKMMIVGSRMQAEQELKALKARVEGTAVVRPDSSR